MNVLLTVVIVAAIIFIIFFIVGSAAQAISRRNRKSYEQDIDFIESCVKNFIVTESNFHSIFRMFHQLRYRNYDKRRTEKVWNTFKKKYNKYFEKHKVHSVSVEDKLN